VSTPLDTTTLAHLGDPVQAARRLAPVLKALADENRLAIMLAIAQQQRSVKELTEAIGLPQTLVSHHLKALRDTGLVTATARGRSNVYALCCDALAEPIRLLAALTVDEPPGNDDLQGKGSGR
jgi:DNA-binding transcriptional ArsR family regulator